METGSHVLIVVRNIRDATNDAYIARMQERGYRVRRILPGESPLPVMEQEAPLATCFQYDYPDLPGLAELRLVKERMPSVPLLMITQAHSEQLAVWAFRAGVRDFFVQPVDIDRFLGVLNELSAIRPDHDMRRRPLRGTLTPSNVIPPEARMRGVDAPGDSSVLDPVTTYVARNLHGKIVQAEAAAICGLSPFQFSRIFKRHYQITFQEYVQRTRIDEAKRMLAHPGASVTDVCFNVGFHDLSYFTRTFHRYVGDTPSHYRVTATRPGRSTKGGQPGAEARLEPVPAGTRHQGLTLPLRKPEPHPGD
jgi:AraC-like DNA-binding protein/ActR/RegA family two-component response regulator